MIVPPIDGLPPVRIYADPFGPNVFLTPQTDAVLIDDLAETTIERLDLHVFTTFVEAAAFNAGLGKFNGVADAAAVAGYGMALVVAFGSGSPAVRVFDHRPDFSETFAHMLRPLEPAAQHALRESLTRIVTSCGEGPDTGR